MAAHLRGLVRDLFLRALDVASATSALPSVEIAHQTANLRGLAARPGEKCGLVVATSNAGKLREIAAILDGVPARWLSLADFPELSLPAEGLDYAANARAKAEAAARQTGYCALADDSGLEVVALDGAPGPFSARYGGADKSNAERVQKLLEALRGVHAPARGARFVCVAALVTPAGEVFSTRGECTGHILTAPCGEGGFGYDPVFSPEGRTQSMAELSASEKNRISHRARAFRALLPELYAYLGDTKSGNSEGLHHTELVLIRHAESTWNAERRWQGHSDPPLSQRGRRQAAEVAERLAQESFAALVCSDLKRALETAELIGARLGLSPHLDSRLREIHLGAWSGLVRAEIEARWPEEHVRYRAGDEDVCPPGGESRRMLRARVEPALSELVRRHPHGRVAVVCHGGVIRVVCPELQPQNAEIVRVAFDEAAVVNGTWLLVNTDQNG